MNTLVVVLLVIFICIVGLMIGGPIGLLAALAACIVIIPIINIIISLLKTLIIGLFKLTTTKKTEVQGDTFECSDCGKVVNEHDKYCPHCGVSFTPPDRN